MLPCLALIALSQSPTPPRFETGLQLFKSDHAYVERELTVSSGGVKFAATLFVPTSPGWKPGVVVAHGAEKASRKGAYYQMLGRLLASNGIAALLFDKRGVGDSGGEYEELPDLTLAAEDLVAVVGALASQKEVDPSRVGVIGSSQAGWIMPLAANRSAAIKFMVAVSGSAASPLEQGIFQQSCALRKKGLPESAIRQVAELSKQIAEYTKAGTGYDALKQRLEELKKEPWYEEAKNALFPPLVPPEYLSDPRLARFKDRNRMLYDPLPALQQLKIPSLWLLGEADETVDVKQTEQTIRKLSRPGDVSVFPRANHGMLVSFEDNKAVYPEGYFDRILSWILSQPPGR